MLVTVIILTLTKCAIVYHEYAITARDDNKLHLRIIEHNDKNKVLKAKI